MEFFVVSIVAWVILCVVVGVLGDGREIGFGKAFLISLLLSPLIGSIFVATSPGVSPPALEDGERVAYARDDLITSGDSKRAARDYDGAIAYFLRVLDLPGKAPHTRFKLACMFSMKRDSRGAISHLSKAVEDGFADFDAIMKEPELDYVRTQPDFERFVQNGYKLAGSPVNTRMRRFRSWNGLPLFEREEC